MDLFGSQIIMKTKNGGNMNLTIQQSNAVNNALINPGES